MEGFSELVTALQVGTRKAPPMRATELALEGAERTLLLELGTLALMRRAGTVGKAATPLPAAPKEALRIADAADPLEEALEASLPAVLEWATEAARKGFVAPHAVLPELVALAPKHPAILPTLGERGRWLAARMEVELTQAETSLPPKEEWETLGPKDRVRLVEALPEGDIAFFQAALDDRRKEVREAAAERLVRLPDSSQTGELRRMALAAVSVHKGLLKSRLEIEPPAPETLPRWLPRSLAMLGLGPSAMALYDLLSYVPPSAWDEPAERMLDLAARTDYGRALDRAWQGAAIRFEDQAWIDALFLQTFEARSNLFRETLVVRASESTFDSEMTKRFRSRGAAMSAALETLRFAGRLLSPSLSREIVLAARAIRGSHDALASLARWLDPSVLPLLDEPWEEGNADSLREGWRKLLDLRRRLRDTLR